MDLVVCASCARHVKRTEPTCPFCRVALVAAEIPHSPMDKRRFYVIAMAIAATSCGKTDAKPDVVEIPTAAPPYGMTAEPIPTPIPPLEDAAVPTIMAPRPPYGIPRNDRGGKR